MLQQSPQINSGKEMVDLFVGGTFPALTALNRESVNPLQIYI
ncbi:hypothetical protein AB4Z50_24745 [Paenibacillus sp. 2TAB26]